MEITTTTTTYKLTQEESAVLLCELAHDINADGLKSDSFKEALMKDLTRDAQLNLIKQKPDKWGGSV